jgi:radical SAM superfamily enzyme YgiQ (UPF0313 family)
VRPLIVDALASGRGKRQATRDVIGAGPRSLAGVLEGEGMKPRITVAETLLDGELDLSDFDFLLASGMTTDLQAVRRVTSTWKKASGGPVLVGGPVASEPERSLTKTGADISVIGEGEQTLKELLELGLYRGRLPDPEALKRVRGIAYFDGVVHFNPLRPAMRRREYDSLEPSTTTIADYPLFRSSRVYVEVLRGCSNYGRARIAVDTKICDGCRRCDEGNLEERYDCPQGISPGCGYCSVPSLFGPPKSRSADKIVQEVEELLSRGVRRVVLSAPGFLDYGRDLLVEPRPLTDPRHPEPNYQILDELFSKLSDLRGFQDRKASFFIENIKGNLVTERAAEILGRHLEGTPVNVGFETGSMTHTAQLGRASTPEENLKAVLRLKREGLRPYVYFIHGLPGQNPENAHETVETIDRCVASGASRIILYRFQPLPMSAFHGTPRAPPAVKDPIGKSIYKAAQRANRTLKENLVGQTVRVVIAERYRKNKRFHVAYPLYHGPVVLVEGFEGSEGSVVDVKIVGVVSDRMVRGHLCDGMF